jgi:hypothetical protein
MKRRTFVPSVAVVAVVAALMRATGNALACGLKEE